MDEPDKDGIDQWTHHERRTLLQIGDPRNPLTGMAPMPKLTTEEFARRFHYRKGSILSPWKDVGRDAEPTGDCQDFAWSVLCIETGGKLKALIAMLTLRAMIWRCWSPQNGVIPRHAALWLRGKGWIDSSVRQWRDGPKPHRLACPAGLPVVLAAGAAIWNAGHFSGWW